MSTGKTILVTGGAGYIGSHTVLRLLETGHEVIVVDNYCNSSRESLTRVEALTGKTVTVHELDICNVEALTAVFTASSIDAVVHFAGLKAVGESVAKPLMYYENNMTGTFALINAMKAGGCTSIVFSSSATVYGLPQYLPIDEAHPLSCTNPYGRTKLFLEDVFRDLSAAEPSWSIVLLRYFNPVGAHASGSIGEDPNGPPNNLLPYVTQTAIGRREKVSVFGSDYETKDGTGVRDYIHVMDLAEGHVAALSVLADVRCEAVNLGTGTGYSVLEMIAAMEEASGKSIPYVLTDRRSGDVGSCYGNPGKAKELLGWEATRGLAEMCADAWRWQEQNPMGYAAPESSS